MEKKITQINPNSEFELSKVGLAKIIFGKRDGFFIIYIGRDTVSNLPVEEENFFLKIPIAVSFKELNDNVIFYVVEEKNLSILNTFKNTLFDLLKKKSLGKKKLKLTGLGYKATTNKSTNTLNMKLGYSHPINITIPKTIARVRTSKTSIVIESIDKITLGNFTNSIYSYKKYDCYKGKGFSKGNDKKKLKEIKKK